MSPDLMFITVKAATNIAARYLQLASRCASPCSLLMKHAAYMALNSVLCDFDRVLPAGPWLFLLAAFFAAAWSCLAIVCAPLVLVTLGVVFMAAVDFVVISWRYFIAAFTRGVTLGTSCSCVGTLGSMCSCVGTLGSGAVSFCSALACFFSYSLTAFSNALPTFCDIIPLLLICDSCSRSNWHRCSIGSTFVSKSGFGLNGVDPGNIIVEIGEFCLC